MVLKPLRGNSVEIEYDPVFAWMLVAIYAVWVFLIAYFLVN